MKKSKKIWIPLTLIFVGLLCLSLTVGTSVKTLINNDNNPIEIQTNFEEVANVFDEPIIEIKIETANINLIEVKYVENEAYSITAFGNLEQYRAKVKNSVLEIQTIPDNCNFRNCDLRNFDSLILEIPKSFNGDIHIDSIKSKILVDGLGQKVETRFSIDGLDSQITVNNLNAYFDLDSMNAQITLNNSAGMINLDGLNTSAIINSVCGNLEIQADAMSTHTEFPHGNSGSYSIEMDGMSNSYSNVNDGQKQSSFGTLQHHFNHGTKGYTITYNSNGLNNTLIVK